VLGQNGLKNERTKRESLPGTELMSGRKMSCEEDREKNKSEVALGRQAFGEENQEQGKINTNAQGDPRPNCSHTKN
jgi:hypothetical protein